MTKLLHTNKNLKDFDVKKVLRIEIPVERQHLQQQPQWFHPGLISSRYIGLPEFMKKLRGLEHTWGFSTLALSHSHSKKREFIGELYIFLTDDDDEVFVRLMMSYTYTSLAMWPSSLKFTCYEFTKS